MLPVRIDVSPIFFLDSGNVNLSGTPLGLLLYIPSSSSGSYASPATQSTEAPELSERKAATKEIDGLAIIERLNVLGISGFTRCDAP